VRRLCGCSLTNTRYSTRISGEQCSLLPDACIPNGARKKAEDTSVFGCPPGTTFYRIGIFARLLLHDPTYYATNPISLSDPSCEFIEAYAQRSTLICVNLQMADTAPLQIAIIGAGRLWSFALNSIPLTLTIRHHRSRNSDRSSQTSQCRCTNL
jgi:hypothetical protein